MVMSSQAFFIFLSFTVVFTIINAVFASSPSNPSKIVNKICNQTSSYTFCVDALYSDNLTPRANAYDLAYISVRLAYLNASDTSTYISNLLHNISRQDFDYYQALQTCSNDYNKANMAIETADNDVNSETFYDLPYYANKVDNAVEDCEAAFEGIHLYPLKKRNHDLKSLCEIFAVLAKFLVGGPP